MATAISRARITRRATRSRERAAAVARVVFHHAAPWLTVTALAAVVWLTGWTATHAPVLVAPIVLALLLIAVIPWPPSRTLVAVGVLGVLAVAVGAAALAVAA